MRIEEQIRKHLEDNKLFGDDIMKGLDLTFVEMVNRNNRAKKYSESVKLRRFWSEWGITGEELGMFAGGLSIFAMLYVLMFI